ncbi:MAG: hypothetical protein K8S23_03820 [Candidatus Cloacimonetes bacterium]|nr:hypothetical protein [Candidatus Cloacimonadota bacterium]
MRTLFLLLIPVLFTNLFSLPKVAVDCVHGFNYVDELQEKFPQYEIVKIDENYFPIDNVIQEGSFPINDSIYVSEFTVTDDMENLYIVTNDYDINEDYFMHLINPDGEHITLFQGILEIENPESGIWQIVDQNCWPMSIPLDYLIGSGPGFLESLNISEFSAMIRIWNNIYFFFYGEVNEYSANEKQIIENWVENGFNYAGIYDTQLDAALKPVIRIYDAKNPVNINVSFDGTPTYHLPKANISQNKLTSYTWNNVFNNEDFSEILYETGMPKSPQFIRYDVSKTTIKIKNQSPYPTYGHLIAKFIGNKSYLIGYGDNLKSNSEEIINVTKINESNFKSALNEHLKTGMKNRRIPAEIAEEFIDKYHWTERIMVDLTNHNDFLSLYLIDDNAYNSIFPLELSENPSELIRQMWMWEINISKMKNQPFFELPYSNINLARDSYKYYEYGVYHIDRNREPLTLFDLTIHNDACIQDPDNNMGNDPTFPIFHNFGQNDISNNISMNVEEVCIYFAPYISFSANWSPIILGDENSFVEGETHDLLSCLVGKESEAGKILIGGTCDLLDLNYMGMNVENAPLPENIMNWLVDVSEDTIYVPQDFETINEAINFAQDNWTIIVSDGVYNESIDFLGKNIILESADGAENCIISPPENLPAIIFENNETNSTVLDGFTIRNATVPPVMITDASPLIKNNYIINNTMGE